MTKSREVTVGIGDVQLYESRALWGFGNQVLMSSHRKLSPFKSSAPNSMEWRSSGIGSVHRSKIHRSMAEMGQTRCNPLNVRFAPNSDHCADIPDRSFVDAPMYSNPVPWAPF